MSLTSRMAYGAWLAASATDARRFHAALDEPGRAQQDVLLNILRRQRQTSFGRQYGFDSIHDIDTFRQRVPLSDYGDYANWLGRMRRGEPNVLYKGPRGNLVATGGSTGGAKQIPHPPTLLRSFRRAIAPWITDLCRQYGNIAKGTAYWSITPPADNLGHEDDTTYLGGILGGLVAATLAVPPHLIKQKKDTFWTTTLEYLLRRRDLSFISIWHPSFMTILLDHLAENWDRLLPRLPPDRRRELKSLGPNAPAAIWPELSVISCWADAHAATAFEALKQRAGGIALQPKGLLATEAFVSIPYQDRHPVAVNSHFFEFMSRDGRTRLLEELKMYEQYEVVATTGGGLYRYRLHDLVVVDGFAGRTPSIRFLGKTDAVSDLVGEKLTEAFVAACLSRVFTELKWHPRFSLLAPNDQRNGYTLYLECEECPGTLGRDVHRALLRNPQYDYAARIGQLDPVAVARIHRDGYRAYTRRLQEQGKKLGDIKPLSLSQDSGWADWFSRR